MRPRSFRVRTWKVRARNERGLRRCVTGVIRRCHGSRSISDQSSRRPCVNSRHSPLGKGGLRVPGPRPTGFVRSSRLRCVAGLWWRPSLGGLAHDLDCGVRAGLALCAGTDPGRGERQGRPRQPGPARGLLLLHRRHHVADPRRLHGVRGGRRASQEHHVDRDEEHSHDRGRHAELLLLRLVHLRLLRARRAG